MQSAHKILISSLIVLGITLIPCNTSVWAGDYTGNETGGTETDCGFPQAYLQVCSDGAGGASWHIYSTSTYSGPTYGEFDGDILTGGITVRDIKRACAKSNFDYYVAYGWDGRRDGPGSGFVHWGPAQWNRGVIAGAQYNSRGALGKNDAIAKMEDGTITDGQRITQSAAEAVHKAQMGTSSIPGSTGFFCSPYRKNLDKFSGRIRIAEVNGGWNDIASNKKTSTSWQQSAKKVIHFINNCDPVNGCTAKFWHALKRDSGTGSVTYTIKRTSNYSSVSSGTLASQKTEKFTSGNSKTVLTDAHDKKLFPGQVVCETLTFKPKPNASNVTLTACIAALGNAQPGDPSNPDTPENPNTNSGDTSFINIKVRNAAVARYDNYQREVYAKPGDLLAYRATYNPRLQYTYSLKPQKMQINGGTIYPRSGINTSATLGALFNLHKASTTPNWNNAFSVQRSRNNSAYTLVSNHPNTVGSTAKVTTIPDFVIVTANDVGSSINEKAITNLVTATKTTPSQVTFTKHDNSSEDLRANVSTASKSQTASAKVPFNFENTTEIDGTTGTTLNAGEVKALNVKLITSPRQNNTLNGRYATKVPGALYKLEICRDNSCTWTSAKSTTLNSAGNAAGSNISQPYSINIPDAPAGTKLCFRSAVYPKNSGTDTNLLANYYNSSDNNSWAYSSQVCYDIVKKPSLQVWGGNIYTNGSITTSVTIKNNLSGYTNHSLEGSSSDNYVFGSWGELGVIANGIVRGFASGASTGYSAHRSGTLVPNPLGGINNNSPLASNPGGTRKTSLCNLSPLTFANSPCTPNTAGSLMSFTITSGTNSDKSAIIDKYIYNEVNTHGIVTLNDPTKQKTDSVYYYGSNLGLTLPSSTIAKATTQVVHSTRDISITGDLTYEGPYNNYDQMPKLVIYAENNINIACNVNRIDAIIIAEKTVKTCSDSTDLNSIANSRQLLINGTIIAGSLEPNRTYGAATGANSIVPAEIINFDSSLYMWGSNESSTTSSETTAAPDLYNTYRKELSPRY